MKKVFLSLILALFGSIVGVNAKNISTNYEDEVQLAIATITPKKYSRCSPQKEHARDILAKVRERNTQQKP